MQNTFSRSFNLSDAETRKFYFTPNKAVEPTSYNVHINGNLEMKKFKMKKEEAGAWKIEQQVQKLPEWLYTLEADFNNEIVASVSKRKPHLQ